MTASRADDRDDQDDGPEQPATSPVMTDDELLAVPELDLHLGRG